MKPVALITILLLALGATTLPGRALGAPAQGPDTAPPETQPHTVVAASVTGTVQDGVATWTTPTDAPHRVIEDALNDGDARSPATYAALQARLIEQSLARQDPTQAPPDLSRVAAGNGDGDDRPNGTIRVAIPAGDLTGDGADDALVYAFLLDANHYTVTAVRGSDGATLWSLASKRGEALVPLPMGDATGDGANDVLIFSMNVTPLAAGDCPEALDPACAGGGAVKILWKMTAHSGPTGSATWTRTFEGRALLASAAADRDNGAAVTAATNLSVLPIPSGDHDGDGGRDLIINALHLRAAAVIARASTATPAGSANVAVDRVEYATDALVARGATGEAIHQRSRGFHPQLAMLRPAGDATGDGSRDLLWTVSDWKRDPPTCATAAGESACHGPAGTAEVTMELLDGANFTTAWRASVRAPSAAAVVVFPSGGDLDGDGAEDLLFYEVLNMFAINATGAISGADGHTAWRQPRVVAVPTPLGAVGGQPGADLLAMAGNATHVTLERRDGATGDILFTTTRALPALDPDEVPENGTLEARMPTIQGVLFGDGDADGVRDAAFDVAVQYTYRAEGPHGVPTLVTLTARESFVESLATGATLYAEEPEAPVSTHPVGDVDGDGADDLARTLQETGATVRNGSFTWHSTLTTRAQSATGQLLWERNLTYDAILGHWVTAAGDLTGDGRADAFHVLNGAVVNGESETRVSRVSGLAGSTGATLWGAGDTIPASG